MFLVGQGTFRAILDDLVREFQQQIGRPFDVGHMAAVARVRVKGGHSLAGRIKGNLVQAGVILHQFSLPEAGFGCPYHQRALGGIAHHAPAVAVFVLQKSVVAQRCRPQQQSRARVGNQVHRPPVVLELAFRTVALASHGEQRAVHVQLHGGHLVLSESASLVRADGRG